MSCARAREVRQFHFGTAENVPSRARAREVTP